AREYIQYSLRFLFHLTKNLTTHLSHNLCAVLPKAYVVLPESVSVEKNFVGYLTRRRFCGTMSLVRDN
ncbi:hypothetical protein, partial [Ruminococcus sp.]